MNKHRRLPILPWASLLAGLAAFASIPVASIAQLPTPTLAVSESFSFTAINFPGTNRTRAIGLNDNGNIVGDYFDSAGVRHVYLLTQGNFTSFDAPGAIETRGPAINNLDVIGGTFLDVNKSGAITCSTVASSLF